MLAPSPRTSRGRDERSSLLEGWGEGLSPRTLQHTMCGDSPSPGFARARESDLSPQAGRGEENARRRLHRSSLRADGSRECAPDDRLREAIHLATRRKNGLLRRFAPRNDGGTSLDGGTSSPASRNSP